MTTCAPETPLRYGRRRTPAIAARTMSEDDCAAWLSGYRAVLAESRLPHGRARARGILGEIAAGMGPDGAGAFDRGMAFACGEVLGGGT